MRGYYYLLPLTVIEWQTTTIVRQLSGNRFPTFHDGPAVPGEGCPRAAATS